MKLNGNLTLARLDDLTEPEFRDCGRCGIQLNQGRTQKTCVDCDGLPIYRANPRQIVNSGPRFLPLDPAYEVFLHYAKMPYNDPTMTTLDTMRVPYFSFYGGADDHEVDWAKSLFNPELPIQWPITVITSHGEVIDFWEGFDLARLNRIPTARETAIAASTTPAEAQQGVPIEQEQAA